MQAMHEGPRERLLRRGASALSDAEVLAVLLGTGLPGFPAPVLAARLLQRCGGLSGLLSRDPRALLEEPGLGPAKLGLILAARELALRSAEEPLRRADVMRSPGDTQRYLRQHLGGRDREVFCCLFLDAQHRLLHCEDLFFGTLDGAAVYPREVAARALRYSAAAVILAHNHPSGVATPSAADRQITERLQRGLALLDVAVLDHVIVGRGISFSFAEAGLL
jgi:DNA repair protein RadC